MPAMGVPPAVAAASQVALTRRAESKLGSPITPHWRAFHAAAITQDGFLVVFGGVNDASDVLNNPGTKDVYVYYTKDGNWYQPTMSQAPTLEQRMHSGVSLGGSRLLFYAPHIKSPGNDGPVAILDTEVWQWNMASREVSTSFARASQSFTLVKDSVYMYGGATLNVDGRVNFGSIIADMAAMDVVSRSWTSKGSSSVRQGHGACYLPKQDIIVVWGGLDANNRPLTQVITYKVSSNEWDNEPIVNSKSGLPNGRAWHSASCVDNQMVVFGGGTYSSGKFQQLSDTDIWVLKPDESNGFMWFKKDIQNSETAPAPRMGHTAIVDNDRILIWGGIGAQDDLKMYALNVSDWSWTSAASGNVLPPSGAISGTSSGDSNSKVVVIVASVCGVVGLLALLILILFIIRRRRKQKASHNNASTVIADTGPMSGTDDTASHALLRKEQTDGSSAGARSDSTNRDGMQAIAAGGVASAVLAAHGNGANASATAATDRANAPPEELSPQDMNGDYATAIASELTPGVRRVGRRKAARRNRTDASAAGGDGKENEEDKDEDDDDNDVDRWTFASSISFGQNTGGKSRGRTSSGADNHAARYYPPMAALPRSRSMSQGIFRTSAQSMGSLAANSPSAISIPLMQPGSPPTLNPPSPLQPGSTISGLVSPLDQIARLRLDQMKRVGEGSRSSGIRPQSSTNGDNASETSSQRSGRSQRELVQVRRGDVRESVEGYLVGSVGSRSVIDAGTLHEETGGEEDLESAEGAVHPGLRRQETIMRIGTDVFRAGSVLFGRYILIDRQAPVLASAATVAYAADDTAGEVVVIKVFSERTAWEREYVALRYLRSPQVAALRNIYNLADERTGTERYVLVTERYGHSLREMLAYRGEGDDADDVDDDENDDNLYELDREARASLARSVTGCLSLCHAQGLVVGDITPESFARSVDDKLTCKLVSLERIRRPGEQWAADSGCATRYCAPEVAAALHANVEVTAAATVDLWSLGCIIYELLAEKPLFADELSDEAVHAFLATAEPHSRLGSVYWTEDRVLLTDDLEICLPDEAQRLAITSLLSYSPIRRLAAVEVLKSL